MTSSDEPCVVELKPIGLGDHARQDCILVGGTQGSLAVPSLDVRWHNAGEESWWKPLMQRREHVLPADPYYEQMRNFAAVIRGDEEPVLSGRDGMLTLATTLAITESAKDGRVIHIDDMLADAAKAGKA